MTLTERATRLQALVFDVDGTLTDGGLWYGPEGEALKRFEVKDGHGFVMARVTHLPIALLTARTSKMVAVRGAELKLPKVFQGWKDKGAGFRALCGELGLAPEVVGYMGDDTNDLGPLEACGLAACPSDAVAEVRAVCHFVSAHRGGHGAARELTELVLRATGRWDEAVRLMKSPAP